MCKRKKAKKTKKNIFIGFKINFLFFCENIAKLNDKLCESI